MFVRNRTLEPVADCRYRAKQHWSGLPVPTSLTLVVILSGLASILPLHETSQVRRDGRICKDLERCQDFVFASLTFAVRARAETGWQEWAG